MDEECCRRWIRRNFKCRLSVSLSPVGLKPQVDSEVHVARCGPWWSTVPVNATSNSPGGVSNAAGIVILQGYPYLYILRTSSAHLMRECAA